jgi:hypothetical protein
MPDSATAVLSTPELLEIILLHSEPYVLIRLQQVCRRFKDHIVSTKALQRRLFIEADPSIVFTNSMDHDHDPNPLPMKKNLADSILLNPFVGSIFSSPSDRRGFTISGEQIHEKWSLEQQATRWKEQKFLLVHLPSEKRKWLSLPEASWRNMTLTQPPITHVAVFMGSPRYPGEETAHSPDYMVVSNPEGVRLGEILDNARERANSAFLEGAPLAIAVLQLASYERIYSACYHAFLRYRRPPK